MADLNFHAEHFTFNISGKLTLLVYFPHLFVVNSLTGSCSWSVGGFVLGTALAPEHKLQLLSLVDDL